MPIEQVNLAPGEILAGKVQGITKFGAFIELTDGVVGLVHISEIADTYVKDVKDFIKEGDEVKVKVLNVSGKKVGLSIKQAIVAPPKRVETVARETPASNRPFQMNRPNTASRMATPSKAAPSKANPGTVSLDDKIAKFLKESDERMQPLKNKIDTKKRNNLFFM